MPKKFPVTRTCQLSSLGLFLMFSVSYAWCCQIKTGFSQSGISEIAQFFENTNKKVITFVGYSGAEYQDPQAMMDLARQILAEFDAETTLVNIGATPQGIGGVYELAKAQGFQTTGIVSTQAQIHEAAISDCVDHVFYIEDPSWGGYIDDSKQLSPTSEAMLEVSDIMVGIGGGEVGRDELLAAISQSRKVCFFEAQMNHQIVREKAANKGLAPPAQFEGAAAQALKHDFGGSGLACLRSLKAK